MARFRLKVLYIMSCQNRLIRLPIQRKCHSTAIVRTAIAPKYGILLRSPWATASEKNSVVNNPKTCIKAIA